MDRGIIRDILALGKANNQTEFDARYMDLLRAVNSVEAAKPRRPSKNHGLRARLLFPLRQLLWSLLQPAIEAQTWRQNAVNRALTLALEFQSNTRSRDAEQFVRHPHPPEATGPRHTDPAPYRFPAQPPATGGQVRRVEQWLAGFSPGDAVSQDALAIQDALHRMGIASELLAPADAIGSEGRKLCRPFQFGAALDDTALRIYHYSIGSPLTQAFLQVPGRRILRYHNVTPAEFFDGFDDRLAAQLRIGRTELRQAAAAADSVWAVSRFNADEIAPFCRGPVAVLPLFFSRERLALEPDQTVRQRLRSGKFTNILFVGRLAPNKHIEDLILAFDLFHRNFNPRSRLLIVGSIRSCPRYYAMLWMLAAALDNQAVCFQDFATDNVLNAYYGAADLFVSASAHEGYGAPLVEAMAHGVPVMARRAGGTPEAMDGAGLLLEDLTTNELARRMHEVLIDESLRAKVLAGQRERINRWQKRDPASELKDLLRTGAAVSV